LAGEKKKNDRAMSGKQRESKADWNRRIEKISRCFLLRKAGPRTISESEK
jgi:hypothetical protein